MKYTEFSARYSSYPLAQRNLGRLTPDRFTTNTRLMHSDDSPPCESLTKHIRCTDVDNVRAFGDIRGKLRLPDVR